MLVAASRSLLTLFAFASLASFCVAEDEAQIASKVVDSLVNQEIDAVRASFDATLTEKLTEARLKAAWKQVEGIVGDYARTDSPVKITEGTYETTVSYSRFALIVRVSLDTKGKVSGLFMRPAPLKPGKPAPETAGSRTLKIQRGKVIIEGTLLLPEQSDAPAMPLAVLHSGSGPTDRDGNQSLFRNDSLKKLAQELSKKGIATFRYDKRGSGVTGMAGEESKLKLQTYVDDLKAVVQKLQTLTELDFASVTLIGHSEGSQICMMAAPSSNVDRVIAIAGSGRPLNELLQSQLKGKLSPELEKQSDAILEELVAERLVDEVPQALSGLYRPSVQPFLISCFQAKPADLAAALKVPMLIVQGDKDIQVSVEDAESLLQAQPKAELKLIAGMNHVLRIVETEEEQMESYGDPNLELAPGLSQAIAEFITTTR